MKQRGGAFTLILGLVLACSAACGDGTDLATTLPDATATAGQLTQTQESDSQNAEPTITQNALSEALLTLSDMPPGWTVLSSEDGEDELDLCGMPTGIEPLVQADSGFQQGPRGPLVGQFVAAYGSGDAERLLQEGIEQASSCTEWDDTQEDGTVIAWRIAPLSFPELGDETFAFRVSADASSFGTIIIDVVAIRRSDLVTILSFGLLGLESNDPVFTERLARLADERLASVVP